MLPLGEFQLGNAVSTPWNNHFGGVAKEVVHSSWEIWVVVVLGVVFICWVQRILLTTSLVLVIMEKPAPRLLQVMSEEQLKAFLEALKADAGLQEELRLAEDADAVVAIAKAAGFMLSADELQKAQAAISEDELERVAGGTGAVLPPGTPAEGMPESLNCPPSVTGVMRTLPGGWVA